MTPQTTFARAVRALEKLCWRPITLGFAYSPFELPVQVENVVAAKRAGVNNYIVKPFNAGTLKAKMSAVLGDF